MSAPVIRFLTLWVIKIVKYIETIDTLIDCIATYHLYTNILCYNDSTTMAKKYWNIRTSGGKITLHLHLTPKISEINTFTLTIEGFFPSILLKGSFMNYVDKQNSVELHGQILVNY